MPLKVTKKLVEIHLGTVCPSVTINHVMYHLTSGVKCAAKSEIKSHTVASAAFLLLQSDDEGKGQSESSLN